ncbi:DUF6515 family protein [Klebsiella sp. R390]|uniref:DUF6515 family protein n=1 Tax=Klebsiella sp. R390 TaxID=2755400 RepID=UPI003DA95BC0
MKNRLYALVMTMLIVSPSLALAGPGPGPGGPGPGFTPQPAPTPYPRLSVLPDLATTLIIGGLTYYIVNDIYYRKQGAEYIRVDAPSAVNSSLNVVDYNGKRYYVRDGSYYQKDINGNYIEVPRPSGL